MELEITWPRAIRVWWAYFWRSILAIVVVAVASGVFGALMGFALGFAGVAPDSIRQVVMPLGMAAGLAASVVPLKMILGRNFGEFRLVLVANRRRL